MKTLLLSGALVLAAALPATAQTRFEVSAGYDFEWEAATVGAGARMPLASFPLTLAPHVDYYFVDNGTLLQGNLDGLYNFPGVQFSPYVGAGLGLAYGKADGGDGDTELGLNLLAGANFRGARLTPYAQIRANLGGSETLGLSAGVIF